MFDAPVDATYVWLGLGAVGVAAVTLAVGLPTTPPPDATALAGVIDRVATADPPSTVRYRTTATEIRLSPDRITLDGTSGTTRARLAFGPIVPVGDGRLARVARGVAPDEVFPTRRAFLTAIERTTTPGWQTGSTVVASHRAWGTDVTLVTVV